jgi:hypothetical protein
MAAAWHSVLRCALVCGAFIIGIHSHELQHRRSASGQLPARSSSSASGGGGGAVRTSGRSILEASAVAASTDSAAEARCPALSRDLLQSVAKQNTVMLAVVRGAGPLGSATCLCCLLLHCCSYPTPSFLAPQRRVLHRLRCFTAGITAAPFPNSHLLLSRPTKSSGTSLSTGWSTCRRRRSHMQWWQPLMC